MDELSIKVKIAEREYPMKVSIDEQGKIKEAERQIAKKIKFFKDTFKIDDMQDLFAMVAFDAVVDKLNNEKVLAESLTKTSDRYNELLNLVKP